MIDIEDLKERLGHPDEEGVTAILGELEEMAVQLVEDETGRFFGDVEARTEYLIGDGTRSLRLAESATVITSVGRRLHIGDDFETITEGNSDGFEIRAPRTAAGRATLLRKGGLGWAAGFEHQVVYDFGYATNAEPKRIRQAVIDLVAFKYQSRGREGLKSFGATGVSWSTIEADDVLQVPGVARTLKLWRVRPMVLQ